MGHCCSCLGFGNQNNPHGDERDGPAIIFTYPQLQTITDNFSLDYIFYRLDFRNYPTYRARLESGQDVVVKVLNPDGEQGHRDQFRSEVDSLLPLHYPMLASLVGYCAENGHCILVSDYGPQFTLDRRLHYGSRSLDWKTRMMIAAGIAYGLNYLHNETDPQVIFRNLNPLSILLDYEYSPILQSDFGFSQYDALEGYFAPENTQTGRPTVKTDVYSFGVVLLGLITGQRPSSIIHFFQVFLGLNKGRRPSSITRIFHHDKLLDWAREQLEDEKNIGDIVDPYLKGISRKEDLVGVMGLAVRCLEQDPEARPDIGEVLDELEHLRSNSYVEDWDQQQADLDRGEAAGTS